MIFLMLQILCLNCLGFNPLKNISVASIAKEKDESHVYEEIDIGLQNGKQLPYRTLFFFFKLTHLLIFFWLPSSGCSEVSCIQTKTSTTSSRIIRSMPFINRSLYEPPCIMSYQEISPSGPSSASVLVSGSQLSSRVQQPLRDATGHDRPCFVCRFHRTHITYNEGDTNFKYLKKSSGSIFSAVSYFPQSSESGMIARSLVKQNSNNDR